MYYVELERRGRGKMLAPAEGEARHLVLVGREDPLDSHVVRPDQEFTANEPVMEHLHTFHDST